MYRKSRPKTRWLDRSRLEPGLYADAVGSSRDSRSRTLPTGLGPYEATYDISNGYGEDRAIVLAQDTAELHSQAPRPRRD